MPVGCKAQSLRAQPTANNGAEGTASTPSGPPALPRPPSASGSGHEYVRLLVGVVRMPRAASARREKGAYRQYSTDAQRRQTGWTDGQTCDALLDRALWRRSQHDALLSNSPGHPLPVQVLEQWDGELAADPIALLEGADVDRFRPG